jgi:type II secretory pathway component PulF
MGGGPGATIDAPDRSSALRELMRRGVTPAALVEVGKDGAAKNGSVSGSTSVASAGLGFGSGRGRAMNRAETAGFVRELATALSAGLPLVTSLKTMARQGRSPRQRAMLAQIIDRVEQGKSMADAFEEWGKPFNDLTISLTKAGELSGRLPEVLSQAAELLDRDIKLRRALVSATTYPMILAVLVAGAIVVLVTFIVPKLLDQFTRSAVQLPWPTRMVQGLANVFSASWWYVLPMVGIAIVMTARWRATPEGRLKSDQLLLRLPLLGLLLRDVAVARFTRTLGTLTAAGLPVLMSLKVTKGTLGNKALEGVIDRVIDDVSSGRTIADTLEASQSFPPMLVQIVNLGERTGKLDSMLLQASGAFEERTETTVKLITTLLPPAMVICLAGVVGFVVLSILLALLQFQDAAMKG